MREKKARNAATLAVELLENRDVPSALPPPAIPRHYEHIRIAQLAYGGTPFGAFEDQLLRNSVDLVIANPTYLQRISSVAPRTPQLLYTNLSSIYLDLLSHWLHYADAYGFDREGAFYHASRPIAFTGGSSGARPVNWFWNVYRGYTTGRLTDLTSLASQGSRGVAFAAVNESLHLGYPDKFREINLNLSSGAARGWSAVLEYPTAVDGNARPTAWATLRTLSNSTAGLTRSGQITFDPPANWQTAALNSAVPWERMYFVRFRTITGGTAPVARTILGRDYVNARGRPAGVIPVFDATADANGDGYLNDTEYARRDAGEDARFFYESRVFDSDYGQHRPATNPADPGFRTWAVDYHAYFLKKYAPAQGWFVDNSRSKPSIDTSKVIEPTFNYADDYGTMLDAVARGVAPGWIMANIYLGDENADPLVQGSQSYYAEFGIRPLAHHHREFEDVAKALAQRANVRSPDPYVVLDSLPTGGSPTDPRTQLATLAYYYLLADPATTFLNFYGGFETSTSWTRHWSRAAAFDIGRPSGPWSVFATGEDPADRSLTYKVYQRSFSRSLVLYKPRSYVQGRSPGSTSDRTATFHRLNGTYRPLRADGTLGAPVTSVTLRNGEGAILIKA